MKKKFPSEADCKRVGPLLERVVDELTSYAGRKGYLNHLVEEFKEKISDPSEYPEEWWSMALAMLGAASVTTVPKRTQGFVRAAQKELSTGELQLAKQWRQVPWVYVVFDFNSVKVVDHRIVLLDPIGDPPPGWPADIPWQQLPVYSPTLASNRSAGLQSGLALLCYDGVVFHTYGTILMFTGFDTADLQYFASVSVMEAANSEDEVPFLLGAPEDAPSLSGAIRKDPISFLMLFLMQKLPVVTGRDGAWRYCASMNTFSGNEDLTDESLWQQVISSSGEKIQNIIVNDEVVGIRLGDGMPMYEPLILVSPEDQVVYVKALTEEAYARGVVALSSLIAMPQKPQVCASMVMVQAADHILDSIDLLTDLEDMVTDAFDEDDDERFSPESDGEFLEDGQEAPDFEAIQQVFSLFMESYNEGLDYTDELIAEKTGVELAQVQMLREQMKDVIGTALPADTDTKPADRFGLPPAKFRRILASAIPAEEGVLVLRDLRGAVFTPSEEASLREVPLFEFARWLVGLETIPATPAGYVAPHIVRSAVSEGILPMPEIIVTSHDGNLKALKRELDMRLFLRYREILEEAGIIRLDGAKFEVHPDIRASDLGTIVTFIAEAMFTRVRWDEGYFNTAVPRLKESTGFLLYAVAKLSSQNPAGWVLVSDVCDVFLGAHSVLPENIPLDDYYQSHKVGSWVYMNIWLNFGRLFGETLGILQVENSYDQKRNGEDGASKPPRERMRPTRQFSILFE